MTKLVLASGLVTAAMAARAGAQPVRVHPDNPHYFEFRGKPALLITSAEHYGAVVNGEFDYKPYLDTLQKYGLNYTRIYPGFLIEPIDKFIKGNTLGPKPDRLVLPWARSDKPGYPRGGNLFDLDRWDDRFFDRLKDFVAQADRRGIVVEVCFFNAQYDDTWPLSPLFHTNNVQGEGKGDFKDAQTLKDPALVRRLDAYVRKVTEAVNGFDNVILEVCDEPTMTGTPLDQAGPWLRHYVTIVKETEAKLPKRHLLGQQVQGPVGGPCDLSADPDVGVVVTQYTWEGAAQQMGGMRGLDMKYGLKKPIELNETNYYPVWYDAEGVAASRVEAWEFMVGGGAGFNHLNGRFTAADPRGDTPDNAEVLRGLKNLKEFLEGFEFVKMHRDAKLVAGGVPKGAFCRAIGEPGRQYAVYLHHSTGEKGPVYQVTPGKYRETLTLALPAGRYQADWVEPATGAVLAAETWDHAGGDRAVTTPEHRVDIALRVRAKAAK
ncbi:MAG: hypothetical protein K2X82_00895 [Gemmataceae bacterium]|nr:hypothetical protein [Gemmataceae bacterium]